MKNKTTLFLWLTIGLVVFGTAWTGDLEPPGPPAPTMVTFQEIYDRVDVLAAGVPGLSVTGQTDCWDSVGVVSDCDGTGQDGEYQVGVSLNPRFTDSGDGTVKDSQTGLTWLKNASCFGSRDWTAALSDANSLADGSCGLTDGSAPGAWRLPNIRELQSLVDYGQYNPALTPGHPFSGVQSDLYWTSTSYENSTDHAWFVTLNAGRVYRDPKADLHYVLPVR